MSTQFDLLIRGGTVIDGTGCAPYKADVGIRAGRIAALGDLGDAVAEQEIDAAGKLVTPGFVDIHTHYDGQAVWDSYLAPSSQHGVTTAVMGNCGVGFAPVKADHRDRLIELMEGVEDIPGSALHEGLSWDWSSFGEYLDALDARPHDIDICAQLPHGALRVFVMGERATHREMATDEDIAQMRRLAREAVEQGAIGFSTTRTLNHRSIKGEPTPSYRASEDELMGIAMGLKDAGTGVLQFITDWDAPDEETEFGMVRRLVEASGRPLSFSLAQRHDTPDIWRRLMQRMDTAVAEGLEIRAQVAPRPVGVLLGLQGSRNPFSIVPAYQAIAALPLDERVARMRNADTRKQITDSAKEMNEQGKVGRRFGDFDRMFRLGDPPNYEPDPADSIGAMARRAGISPVDLAYDEILADEGRCFLFAPFANFAAGNLDVCGEMLASPNTVIGLGDGGAHVSIIGDASFPTYLFMHWGRDRARGRFPLEYLIKKHTADCARAVGLLDRGVLATGMKADLNVIDFDQLALERPFMANDLPAGGHRLLQQARGYAATVVSGEITYRDGQSTGALPGKLVRGAQAVPA